MKADLRELHRLEQVNKTLKLGGQLSRWGLPILSLMAVTEVLTHQTLMILACRLLGIVPLFVFFTLTKTAFRENKSTIIFFHSLSLLGLMIMMLGIVIIRVETNTFPLEYQLATITGGLTSTVFVVYLFSAGASKSLPYVTLLPLLSALTYFYAFSDSLTLLETTFFINPLLAGLGAIVLSRARENLSWQEFKMRVLAQQRKQQLEGEIVEREKLEEQLRELASRDSLTGLLNRRAMFKILEENTSSGHYILCYIDLDNLKQVNDRFGHSAGDAVLVTLANYLQANVREQDYVCRLGGDEYLIVFGGCSIGEAEKIVARLKLSLEKELDVSFSHGLAEYTPNHSISLDAVLDQADKNMYRNKHIKKQVL